ncbi:NAD-dependent epimerase/dehydratase family protein [Chloroflexota bacterium]
MKKILITGRTGFIGRNLKEQLVTNYEIITPPSNEINLLDSEEVETCLRQNNFDVIIHCATWNATRNSNKDLSKILENNLRMYFNLARYQKYYGKMIYYGSGAEFSREHWKPRMREDYFDIYIPTDQYGFSKYIMCKHAEKSQNIYNLRLFGVFGRYEDYQIRFISNAICKVIFELPITIEQNVFFDYLYIDDLIKITRWYIEHEPDEKIFNICTGSVLDLYTIAQKIFEISEKKLDIRVCKDDIGREYSGDNSKLLNEIPDCHFRDINVCIQDLYHWYKNNMNNINSEKLVAGI